MTDLSSANAALHRLSFVNPQEAVSNVLKHLDTLEGASV